MKTWERYIHNKQLDLTLLVRGTLAILIIWWHTTGYQVFGNSFWAIFHIPGRIAVWMFFILSGYVIGYGFIHSRYKLDMQGILSFYAKRIFRIYPLFLVVSFASFMIISFKDSTSVRVDSLFFIRELLMVQWSHHYPLMDLFWTLGIEMQFYLLSPLLFLMNEKGRSLYKIFIIYFLLLTGTSFLHIKGFSSWDDRTILGNLIHFQAGFGAIYLYTYLKRISFNFNSARMICIGLTSVAVILLSSWFYHAQQPVFWIFGAILVDAATILILLLHQKLEAMDISLTREAKILSLFGVLSYGLYGWSGLIGQQMPFVSTNFWGTLGTALILALLSYKYIEIPLLKLKDLPKHWVPKLKDVVG